MELDAGLRLLCSTRRGKEHSQTEIARACGCSPQRISQIEQEARKKLVSRFEHHGLRLTRLGFSFA